MTVAELIEELKECPQDVPVNSGIVGELEEVLWRTESDGEARRIVAVVLS